jgi:L-asparagine transporter-like permease
MNFVVLSAALSSSNANLYLISRTLFSLARSGHAPAALGAVDRRGAPLRSLLISSIGLAVIVLIQALWSKSAYLALVGISLFGALLVWFMIFVTHIAFKRPARPLGSYAGAIAIAAILVSTWWIPDFRVTLIAGGPWLALLAIGYLVSSRAAKRRASSQ